MFYSKHTPSILGKVTNKLYKFIIFSKKMV